MNDKLEDLMYQAELSDEQGVAVMNCIIKHFEDHEYERTD